MSIHEDKKHCAECGCEIKQEYFMVTDNFLQIKYFDEEDGSDNIFCSQSCICEALSVMCVTIDEVEK